jgi:type II secretory pathway pseudopilin PulG
MRTGRQCRRRQFGFTYVSLLFALILFGLGLAQVGPLLADQTQRDRERELLLIGEEVVAAIRAYHLGTPGAAKRLPVGWPDLLEDRRSVQVRRHLRRVPRDPLTNSTEWEIVRDSSGAMLGIRSKAAGKPFRTAGLAMSASTRGPAARYSDWSFIYEPPVSQ